MRTELRIVARPGVLPEIHASGGLSARRTGPRTVHLIGTAATPLGGDELDIVIVVAAGAELVVRSVAATLALPGRATPLSSGRWQLEVGSGGVLDFDPEPMIVAGGARHQTVTTIRLDAGARLRMRERVQLGRTGEDGGQWRGDLIADVDDMPLLRHRLALGAGTPADDALSAPRALESELVYPDECTAATADLRESRLPLAAGGSLFTRTGSVLRVSGVERAEVKG
ncbi:urease accessory protein UreD [Nocardia implantans]|uniref:Urease accessory protein UreD n=1 Tax=Nocardia implantans TaxID=3108168 RepID=A0ABU6AUI3_9NOCA|nr:MULTISPECIES: urease accessory protein UreD [unclassified Nocardia]MBF6192648.1 urease accessory protein UreD [Nocardia beijingensis]MEA3527444.1 urease accessory protein UreD [Nocardia sp. CDC192]MEB3511152.1 urease accessory protein UreD [Nocardia sp. CDC186]